MRQPKGKARRCRGGLRDAIVGVRLFDCSLYRCGYAAVWSLDPIRVNGRRIRPGLVMFRPCCVIELRPAVHNAERVIAMTVTHGEGEIRILTREPLAVLLDALGDHAGRIPYVG